MTKPNPTLAALMAKNPCSEGAAFISKSRTLKKAWATCGNVGWMTWALNALELFDDKKARTFACDCASHTLHFFEHKYPGDKRPRLAIEASWRTITDQSNEALAARDAARDAARAAAWAAERDAENQWQCSRLRQLIDPFKALANREKAGTK